MPTELRILREILASLIRAVQRTTDLDHAALAADFAESEVRMLLGVTLDGTPVHLGESIFDAVGS